MRVFPTEIETILIQNGVVNGLGGKGGFPIDKFFQDNIVYLDEFLPVKGEKLLSDIRRLSTPHDLGFLLGGTIIDFWIENYRFAKGVYQLLHWTSFKKRVAIFLIIFTIINREGKTYFNFK